MSPLSHLPIWFPRKVEDGVMWAPCFFFIKNISDILFTFLFYVSKKNKKSGRLSLSAKRIGLICGVSFLHVWIMKFLFFFSFSPLFFFVFFSSISLLDFYWQSSRLSFKMLSWSNYVKATFIWFNFKSGLGKELDQEILILIYWSLWTSQLVKSETIQFDHVVFFTVLFHKKNLNLCYFVNFLNLLC
jgi:hypothetical protein